MNTQFLIQLLVNGLVVGTLYGVVAMSFVLIYKASQVVNFAQGELLLIGAWVCWALLAKYEVPFWIGMPLTLIFMFVFGIAIQIVILRPERRVGSSESGPVRPDPEDGDEPWPERCQPLLELARPTPDLVRAQFVRPRGGSGDEVRQAEVRVEQRGVLER